MINNHPPYRGTGQVPVVPGPPAIPGDPPAWADLVADHGNAPISPVDGGYPPMDPPPWETARHKPAGAPIVLAVFAAMLMVVLLSFGFLVQRANLLPAGVPLIGKDTGVALCEAMAKGKGPTGAEAKTPISGDELWKIRSAFADSRYEAIRLNGVQMMDTAAQIEAMGDDPGLGALAFMGSFADAYAGLAGGCADVGHPLPALTAN